MVSLTKGRRTSERYHTDEEFRNKQKAMTKRWRQKNREKIKEKTTKWRKTLSEFRNRHCKECGKLLNWQTKGEYCRIHFPKHYNRKTKKEDKK